MPQSIMENYAYLRFQLSLLLNNTFINIPNANATHKVNNINNKNNKM